MAHSTFVPSLLPTAKVSQDIKPHAIQSSGDLSIAFIPDETTSLLTFTDKHEKRAYLKHKLALAFCIFAQFRLAERVAGHIRVCNPVNSMSFLVNPFGVHFSLISDEGLIRVNLEGMVVDGGRNRWLNYGMCNTSIIFTFLSLAGIAAYAIQAQIHTARPDILYAAHSHTTYNRTMCASGKRNSP